MEFEKIASRIILHKVDNLSARSLVLFVVLAFPL